MNKEREKTQMIAGAVSVLANALLFAAKLWVALLTGSLALMADAWHTMSDSATSVFVVAAAKLASRKPDKKHPFGHGRWELIASFFMAVVLAIIGYEFMVDAVERFINREAVVFGTVALVITIISIVVKELLAQYAFYLGRKHNNPVITADGWHSRSDSLSSGVVLIGIIITRFTTDGLWWMDSILGAFCALAIFYAAFKILKDAISKTLGEAPDQEFIDKINAAIKDAGFENLNLHHFHIHDYVTHKELTFHMRLDSSMTIQKSHDIATSVEDLIKQKFSMESTIHVEPLE